MARRKTTINPGFIRDKESGEPDSSSVDSIVEGKGKPEPVTIDVDEFDENICTFFKNWCTSF